MIFEFDGGELDLEQHRLLCDGQVVPVEPQVFALLAVLLRHRYRVVPKEELLDTVWGSRFVTESALTSRVKSARKAIGDDGRGQRLIRTVHGHGYQFVGGVVERAVVPGSTAAGVVPAQLPLAVRGFVGRAGETARLDTLLGDVSTVVVAAVSGAPGVGKTSLALHWAHRVAGRFPDGQLYVNLRGFDPGGSVMPMDEALRGFLDALGVPAGQIPAELDARVTLYRSVVAGRRLLVVLDNARDTEQVRPLLPGAPGCLVVVTSRDRLTPLVAGEGAAAVALDLLPVAESRDLLAERLGAGRVAAEPAAVDELIARCGRLPLALSIAAAHAMTRPHSPLSMEAAQLRDAAGGLDAFEGGAPTADVRAVFSWSYRALDAGTARLFRLLALHAGPDIGVAAALSLAGGAPDGVRAALRILVRANLLTEPLPGRFRLHDLLRVYAGELAHADEPDADRHAAVRRLLDHYACTAHAAALRQEQARVPIDAPVPLPGAVVTRHPDHDSAMAWFAAEHETLLAAVGTAAEHGLDHHLSTVAWSLTTWLDWRGRWPDLIAVQSVAVEALRRLGDVRGQAHAHRDIGRTYCQLGRHADGRPHLDLALRLYTEADDGYGQARTHHNIGWMLQAQDLHLQALPHSERATELFRGLGEQLWLARSLNGTAWLHAQLGRHRQAGAMLRQALDLARSLQDRHGEASILDSLGDVHRRLGDHAESERCYQLALHLIRDLGDHHGEAEVLKHLGDAREAAGDHASAHEVWHRSLTLFQRLNHPSAAEVRRRLRAA